MAPLSEVARGAVAEEVADADGDSACCATAGLDPEAAVEDEGDDRVAAGVGAGGGAVAAGGAHAATNVAMTTASFSFIGRPPHPRLGTTIAALGGDSRLCQDNR